MEIERSIHAEEETAAALLGDGPERKDGEDGSTLFTNRDGESVVFQRDGTIEARLRVGEMPERRIDREHVAELVLVGFPTHLTADLAGVQLFDRALEIRFKDGWAQVSGRWTLELPYTTTGSSVYYDGADALLTYAYQAAENTVIQEMTLGYRLGEENAGRTPLVVCWRIRTNHGVEFLDTSKMTIQTEEIS